MNINGIEEILKDEPKYRLKQVKQAMFCDLIENWEEAMTLPKKLREKLAKECPLGTEVEIFESNDNQTKKALIILADGKKIETVLMSHQGGRNTVCGSSQVGCALGCSFCATGKQGFSRNLEASEIAGQVLVWNRYLKKQNQKADNIVLMGMGEPFLNYNEVMKAVRLFNDKDAFNIGARKISISTVGIVPGIEKLADEGLQINLAISLHAPNNQLRTKLMPINATYDLDKILAAVGKYIKKTNRQVMFEYLMIDGVNDSQSHAMELLELFKNKPLYMLNLISYNPTGNYHPSRSKQIRKFQAILGKNHIRVTVRKNFGHDIKAACGQLAGAGK